MSNRRSRLVFEETVTETEDKNGKTYKKVLDKTGKTVDRVVHRFTHVNRGEVYDTRGKR
jgi:hypothetical protein